MNIVRTIAVVVILSLSFLPTGSAGTPYFKAIAEKTLDKLFETLGQYRYKKPTLEISTDKRQVAAYLPGKNTIILEESAYALCRSFGKDSLNALAFLLGHELSHALQKEVRDEKIQTNFLSYDKAFKATERTEKTADVQGIFTAYLAGFRVVGIVPNVIEAIYDAYDLKGKTLSGYPTFEARKATADDVMKTVEMLIDLYETANYMSATSRYELAGYSYEYILQFYQGREIYNNLGVLYALQATEYWDARIDLFAFPLEMDQATRLNKSQKARGTELNPLEKTERQRLLLMARTQVEEALRLDPSYLPAKTNLVCLLNLMNRPAEALAWGKKNGLMKLLDSKKAIHAPLQLAIALGYALSVDPRDQATAKDMLSRLSYCQHAGIAAFAKHDMDACQGKPIFTSAQGECPLSGKFSALFRDMDLGKTNGAQTTTIQAKKGISFYRLRQGPRVVTGFSDENGKLVSLKRFTNPLTAGIRIPSVDLENPTGATHVVISPAGYFLSCEQQPFVVQVDNTGKVMELAKVFSHTGG